ncbi:MAG: hypothetical protein ACRDRA_06770 [Pseudonocardiaceae bacterium]
MTYVSSSSIRISAWAAVHGHSEITYQVYPAQDIAEFTLGGRDGLQLNTSEAGLRQCVAAFTGALDAFDAAALPPDVTSADLVPAADPPTGRAR